MLALVTDNQAFFQWSIGIVVVVLSSLIGIVIRNIKQDILAVKTENAELRGKMDSMNSMLLEKLASISLSIARVEVKLDHERPTHDCMNWMSNLKKTNSPRRQKNGN
jgi:hypothetical protein